MKYETRLIYECLFIVLDTNIFRENPATQADRLNRGYFQELLIFEFTKIFF